MTRPNALVGALAAVCVGTLLWLAWQIVAADLTLGTSIAAWGLWLLVLLTATTLVAYARELGRHRSVAGRPRSWRPLPGLVLLWIGGLTAVPVLALMLPQGQAPAAAKARSASSAISTPGTTPGTDLPSVSSTSSSSTSSSSTSAPRRTQSEAARSADRTSPTPSRTSAHASSPTPRVTTTTTSTTTTTTTTPTTHPDPTTTTPVIDITILPNGHTKTKPPGS